jgi:glycosyltransferase involved in cell wall biosynthesis
MGTNPIISVIICVYNGEKHLAETLESVARQYPVGGGLDRTNGIEVIMIDDVSTDSSPAIIQKYASALKENGFSVQSVFHSENKNIINSYNEGVALAKGKYFKILDHDDVLASDRALADPVEFMEQMEGRGVRIGAVFSKTLYMDNQSTIFGEKRFPFPFLPYEAQDGLIPRKWGEFVLAFSPIYPFVHGSSIVRKACWEELSVDQLRHHGSGLFDVLFALHVMHSPNWRVGYLRTPALQYRIHSSSFTQSIVSRATWAEILISHYQQIYGNGFLLALIKAWTRCVQNMKSAYHSFKGRNAFKSIGMFGRRK